jgi:N-acetylmuramoyl-L-alanine amidase
MNIIKSNLKFTNLTKRNKTEYIVLHHIDANNVNAFDIHRWHLNKGWSGIGYHFLVKKDGTIQEGRPIDTVGSHTLRYNAISVGVAFEGRYMNDTMPDVQYNAGMELISYLKGLYPNAQIKGHKDLQATACPGSNFPLDKFKGGVIMSKEHWAEKDYQELIKKGIVINEKRFDDKITRGELFALLNRIVK